MEEEKKRTRGRPAGSKNKKKVTRFTQNTYKLGSAKYETHVEPFLPMIGRWFSQSKKVVEICEALSVSTATWYKYIEEHPELAKIVEEKKDIVGMVLEKLVYLKLTTNPSTKNNDMLLKALKAYNPAFEKSSVLTVDNRQLIVEFKDKSETEKQLSEYSSDMKSIIMKDKDKPKGIKLTNDSSKTI